MKPTNEANLNEETGPFALIRFYWGLRRARSSGTVTLLAVPDRRGRLRKSTCLVDPVRHLVRYSMRHSMGHSVKHLVKHSVRYSVRHSMRYSMRHPMRPSVRHPVRMAQVMLCLINCVFSRRSNGTLCGLKWFRSNLVRLNTFSVDTIHWIANSETFRV